MDKVCGKFRIARWKPCILNPSQKSRPRTSQQRLPLLNENHVPKVNPSIFDLLVEFINVSNNHYN